LDPVTHAAVARMTVSVAPGPVSRIGALLPILGGLAPDVDAVFMPLGWDIYLRVHEAGTHSAAGGLLLAVLVAALFRWRTASAFGPLVGAATIAVFSHIALDALSGATIRPGWPFASYRTSIGLVGMADPWFVAPVAVALAVSLARGCGLVRVAPHTLAILGLLLLGKFVSRAAATDIYEASRAVDPVERYVQPQWGSLTGWWVYERTADRLRTWRVDAVQGTAVLRLEVDVPSARLLDEEGGRLSTVRNFLSAHDLPVRVAVSDGQGRTVYWSDLRFCWRATAGPDPSTATTERPSSEPVACRVWFGGRIDAAGSVGREFVTIGDYVQER